MAASLLFVHTASYEPAVSYILLYLVSSVGIITAAVVVPLLPEEQFTAGFCGSIYALYAAVVAMMVFFSGGTSSEFYVMFFPLLLASALHGSWRVVLATLVAVLFCYGLAMLPGLLEEGTGQEIASLVFYRLAAVGLAGLFLIYVARSVFPAGLSPRNTPWMRTGPYCSRGSMRSSGHAGGRPSPWYLSIREEIWRLWISSSRGCTRVSGSPCCSGTETFSGWF